MLKFGLDWSWVDLNYSKYTISESEEPGSGSVGDIMDETIDIGNHQLQFRELVEYYLEIFCGFLRVFGF